MTITENYLARAELWMLITTLAYFIMNGAQVFETAVFVPKWTANPPETFSYLTDKNGTGLKTFWMVFHSLHEITFILAIIYCWKIYPVRNGLLVLFTIHFAVRLWTLSYFAPNIIEFQKIAEGFNSTTDLLRRTQVWKILNYVRVGVFIAVSIALVPLFFKLINIRLN